MIQYYIDERRQKIELPDHIPVAELVEKVSTEIQDAGMIVSSVALDGQEVTQEYWEEVAGLPAESFARLDLRTNTTDRLAMESLVTALDYLPRLNKGLAECASLVRLGDQLKANELYVDCIEGIRWFFKTMECVRQLLSLSFHTMAYGGESVEGRMGRTLDVIDQMLTAQTGADWVLLADFMEYELLPILEEWVDILPLLIDDVEPEAKVAEAR